MKKIKYPNYYGIEPTYLHNVTGKEQREYRRGVYKALKDAGFTRAGTHDFKFEQAAKNYMNKYMKKFEGRVQVYDYGYI